MRIFFLLGIGLIVTVLLSIYLFMEPIVLFASNRAISFYNDTNISTQADAYKNNELYVRIREHTTLTFSLPVENLFSIEKIPFKLYSDDFSEFKDWTGLSFNPSLDANGIIYLSPNGYGIDTNISSKLAEGTVHVEIKDKHIDALHVDFKDIDISNFEVNSSLLDISKLLNKKYSLQYDGKFKDESTLDGKALLQSNGVYLTFNNLSFTYKPNILASGNFLVNMNNVKELLRDFNVSTNNDNAKIAGIFKTDNKDFKIDGYMDIFDLNSTYSLNQKELNLYVEALNPSLLEDIITQYKLDNYKEYLDVHVNNIAISHKLDENKTDVKFFLNNSLFPLAKATKSVDLHCADTLLYNAFMAISVDDNLHISAKLESEDINIKTESIKYDLKEYIEGKLFWSIDLSKITAECLKMPLYGKMKGVSSFIKNGNKIAHSTEAEVAKGKLVFFSSPKETYADMNSMKISSLLKTFKKDNKYFDGVMESMRFDIVDETIQGNGIIKKFHFIKGEEINKIATFLGINNMIVDYEPISINFTSSKENILVKSFVLKSKELVITISDILIDKKSKSIATSVKIETDLHHIELDIYGSVSKPKYIINIGTIPKEIFSVIGGGIQGILSIPIELIKNVK